LTLQLKSGKNTGEGFSMARKIILDNDRFTFKLYLRTLPSGQVYSKVWFNTPRLAAAQITQRFQKFGIKPDGIINFLSNEPPFKQK
jgi:hypothetical protein